MSFFPWNCPAAKWRGWENLIALWKSLMYIKNRRGPKTDPCGTPYLRLCPTELRPFIMTNCFLLERLEENHNYWLNLFFHDAFCKLIKILQTKKLLSIAFSILSMRLIIVCAVENFFWNPNCFLWRIFWSFKKSISLMCLRFSIILSRFEIREMGL